MCLWRGDYSIGVRISKTTKTESTYHELFTAILNRCAVYGVRPDPDVVTVDFELAVPRARAAVFGQHVQVQFCFST